MLPTFTLLHFHYINVLHLVPVFSGAVVGGVVFRLLVVTLPITAVMMLLLSGLFSLLLLLLLLRIKVPFPAIRIF